eukprot:55722-Amphidinium_carterae.2
MEAIDDPESRCVIQQKTNMLYSSTTVQRLDCGDRSTWRDWYVQRYKVSNGACLGVACTTGMKTEIGIIQSAAARDAACMSFRIRKESILALVVKNG